MQEWAPTYIAQINRQRKRLRNNMSEAAFRTWYALTSVVLECVPGVAHLQHRLSEVRNDNIPPSSKVTEARRILTLAVEFIKSPLFGISKSVPIPSTQASGISMQPQMTQIQNVTQSISPDLNTLLKRVDEQADLRPENKEEAKSLVKKMWDQLTTGRAKDIGAVADIVTRLATLGINVQQILSGLQLG